MRKWSDWSELMVAAQEGNAKMYNQLLVELSSYLAPYIKYKVGSESISSEIVQDILMSVHSSRHTFNPEFPFKPWLFKITQSRLIDYYRKNKNKYELHSVLDDSFIESITAESEFSQIEINDFKNALNTLSAEQKEILIALKIDGQSIKEIAESKKMTESAVKTTAHRAYKALSLKLGAEI